MRRTMRAISILAVILLAGHGVVDAQDPLGTAFTYQGELKEGGIPADGDYDLLFRLFDAPTGGTQIGGDDEIDDWTVRDGLFTVPLDFGPGIFTGDALWLEVAVRQSNDPYTTLLPRQPMNATPYALYALDGPGSAGFWAANGDDIYNTNSGNVGIGTTSPVSGAKLEVDPATSQHGIYVATNYIPVRGVKTGTGSFPGIHGETESTSSGASGVRGVVSSTDPGSESAGVWGINHGTGTDDGYGVRGEHDGSGKGVYGYAPSGLGVEGRSESGKGVAGSSPDGIAVYGYSVYAYGGYFIGVDNNGSIAALCVQNANSKMLIDGNEIDSNGALYLNRNSTNDVYIASGGGNVIVPVLQITGADVAERFPVSEVVKPGMVVAIDQENAGQLCLARGAYNRCVAGVVSGANGLSAGAVLGNMPGQEDSPAIALGGRVWVYCDATEQPIEAGNLLTTAERPGYAMAVTDHERAQGAVLGKAMTRLPEGEMGLVLVLVNLQ